MSDKIQETSVRQLMFAETIRRAVADILVQDILLERIGVKRLTIAKASTGSDLRIVKLYVDFPHQTKEQGLKAIENLQRFEGKIKSLLVKKIILRFVPALKFVVYNEMSKLKLMSDEELAIDDNVSLSEDML